MGLTNQLGNTAPVRRRGRDWQIRDALAQQSLDNAPPPESYLENAANRRSYSEMLAERIAAEHARAIKEGWQFLSAGNYRQAILCFEAAETANRDDPEAAVGIICAAITDKHPSYQLAYTVLLRVIGRGRVVFDVDIDLRDKHSDPDSVTHMVGSIQRLARQSPADLNLAAMSAFLLWFSGERDEALRVADRIHEEHRTSPFASMAAQMRGESAPPQDEFSMTEP